MIARKNANRLLAGRGRWPGLVALAIAWIAGGTLALAGHHLIAMPLLLGVAAGALLLMLRDRRAALVLVLALGAAWATHVAGQALAGRLSPALEGETIVVTGRVASLPRVQPGRVRFQFAVAAASTGSGRALAYPHKIALSWYRPPAAATLPQTGERWRFEVRLRRPRNLADPGAFDYAGWALAHGIGASGYVYRNRAQRLAPAGAGLGPLRARIARAIANALPGSPYAGLIAGLAVGAQTAVSQTQWQTLRATGTTHLLSVSGLHLALVAVLVYFAVLTLARRVPLLVRRVPARVIAVGAAAPAAIGYAALAGFALGTERSLVMLTLPLLALMFRRRIAVADALAFAAIVVTLYTPLALVTASFWLSFGAVAALVYGLRSARPGRGLIRAQLVVSLGIAPLVAAFFGQVSLVGPLANLCAIPVVGWLVVPASLAGAIATLLHAGWGAPCFHLAAFVLARLWPALAWMAALPHATLALGPAGWLVLAAALVGACLLLAPRGLGLRLAGLALLVPLILPASARPAPGDYRVTVLDVGQGLAVVVTTAHHVLLVDTGPRWWGGNDAGREIVIPFLRAHRLGRPDLLLLSHADSDHAGGLGSIEQAWPGLPILSSVPGTGEPCLADRRWRWDGVAFAILAPPAGAAGSRNDRSCVLRVSAAGGSVLLPGDIEAERERWLLAHARPQLAAALLIAPHHGSATSSTPDFVAAVHPRFVVFATGYRNRYHFPRPEVLARYRDAGALLLDSAHGGALGFVVNRDGVRLVSRYRPEHARPWTDP